MNNVTRELVQAIKEWGESMKQAGLIPTIDLFVEEMTKYLNNQENK